MLVKKEKAASEAREKNAANADSLRSPPKQYDENGPQEQMSCFIKQNDDNRDNNKTYDEIRKEKRKAYARSYYSAHKDERRLYNRKYYRVHRDEKLLYSRKYYNAHREEKKKSVAKYNYDHKEEKRIYFQSYYSTHKDHIKACVAEHYSQNMAKMKRYLNDCYETHKDQMGTSCSEYYEKHANDRKDSSKQYYESHVRRLPEPDAPSTSENVSEPVKKAGRAVYKKRNQQRLLSKLDETPIDVGKDLHLSEPVAEHDSASQEREDSRQKIGKRHKNELIKKNKQRYPKPAPSGTHNLSNAATSGGNGWQVFGVPLKEENSLVEELQADIMEYDEVVKEEFDDDPLQDTLVQDETKTEGPVDDNLSLGENLQDGDLYVKVGLQDSDECKKEDINDGDLNVIVGIQDSVMCSKEDTHDGDLYVTVGLEEYGVGVQDNTVTSQISDEM